MSNGLNNPMVCCLNCVRISVKDTDIFKLKCSFDEVQEYGDDNVQKFNYVKPNACNTVFLIRNCQRYHYDNFNSFMYTVYMECLNWTLTGYYKLLKAEYMYPIEFIQGFQGAPLFMSWNLYTKYGAEKPRDDRLSSNPNSQTIFVSSKRSKNFCYFVHSLVSRYLDCKKARITAMSLDFGAYLNGICGQGNFRVLSLWFSTFCDLFTK